MSDLTFGLFVRGQYHAGDDMTKRFEEVKAQVRLAEGQVWSRSSRRSVPMRRSQIAFIRGACTAVRTMVTPAAWKTASGDVLKFGPRSRMRNRKSPNLSPGPGARLRAGCTVQ